MQVKRFLFICVMILPLMLKAQRPQPEGRWAITLAPAMIPLPYGGQLGIQPGFEYHFSGKLALLSEFTFQVTGKNHPDSVALNTRYFRIKHELRYHFPSKTRRIQQYMGLQGSYSFRSFRNGKKGFYYDNLPPDQVYYYDKANINSPITTLSVQTGAILSDKKRFSADVFLGMGARFTNTRFRDVHNLRAGPITDPEWFNNPASYETKGRSTGYYLNAGIRFMYHFGQAR